MSKLRKAEVLMEEAAMDLEHGSYNKAVSASYFAVRLTVEHFIEGLRTTKDDKIANALFRIAERKVGREEATRLKGTFLFLFNERKRADHRPHLFSREEAERIVRVARSLRDEITRILTGGTSSAE